MPDPTLPLDDLTQQIAQRESELQWLRQQYEARQARLAELARQREALQAQLRQVEDDIQAETRGEAPSAPAPPVAQGTPATSPKPTARLTLSDALVEVLREVNRPLTARELGEELVGRKFPTTSSNITNLVHNRLSDLVKRGVLRRAPGQPGVLLAESADGTKAAAATIRRDGPAAPANEAARKTAPARPPQPGWRGGQPPLRSVLTELLQKSRKPLAARDLAEQVLATGYQTKSKDFTDVVWTALGQLDNVENVKGKGWRLKKG
ncbi:MAG TPA: hypothetical protein VKA46_37715 [Gemmataceae bacterium]|nr:hypothetical protein [Gemmataceae bacterium]